MKNSVFISIHPEDTNLIKNGEKDHIFKTYKFGKKVKYFFVYESFSACLKYIFEVDIPVEFPNKIETNKIGNSEFNEGISEFNFAFPIRHVYELNTPLTLTALKSQYQFCVPQKYTYASKYSGLTKYLENCSKMQIY